MNYQRYQSKMIMREHILKIMQPYVSKMWQHPFNKALCDGSLPFNIFQDFLEQDKIYLNVLAKSLTMIASRLEQTDHTVLFTNLSNYIKQTEMHLHEKYLETKNINFFKQARQETQMIKSIQNYTKHIKAQADNANVISAVASTLPCFYLYSDLVEKIKSESIERYNRYYKWLLSYTSHDFNNYSENILNTISIMSDQLNESQKNEMLSVIKKSASLEIAFWNNFLLEKEDNTPITRRIIK